MKTLTSSVTFWTMSVTPGEGKFLGEEPNWRNDVVTAARHVHGVFLDYDCAANKDTLAQVS
jgi:hypothetical protein